MRRPDEDLRVLGDRTKEGLERFRLGIEGSGITSALELIPHWVRRAAPGRAVAVERRLAYKASVSAAADSVAASAAAAGGGGGGGGGGIEPMDAEGGGEEEEDEFA